MHAMIHFFRWFARFPELVRVEPGAKKLARKACRWEFLKHWQIWIAFIINSLCSVFFIGGLTLVWMFTYYYKAFSLPLVSLLTLLSAISYLVVIYICKKIDEYYVSPCIIRALPAEAATSEVLDEHARLQDVRRRAIKKGMWFSAGSIPLVLVLGAIIVRNPAASMPELKMRDELKSPRIVKNMDRLTKSVLLEDERLGYITDIAFRKGSDGKPGQMILAGTRGALFIADGDTSKFVAFSPRQDHVDSIYLDSHGTHGFMNRGAWCSQARVMDESGRVLWSYGERSPGIDDMASGDINGDGNVEYVVGFNGGGGIHLLDSQGKKQWEFSDGNVWHVEIADLDGDGRKKIVHSNAAGEIKVRDSQGKVISKSRPTPYFSDFSLIRWPGSGSPQRLLLAEDNAVWIFDDKANVLAKFLAPDAGTLGFGRGTLFAMEKEKNFVATIVDFKNWERSILYLHDPSGQLVYQEIMPESCRSISIVSDDQSKSTGLVIGCKGKLFEYRATGQTH